MSRKGENIYKRKDGRWEGRYIKSYENGKAKYGYLYAKTYKDVREKLSVAKNVVDKKDDKVYPCFRLCRSRLWLNFVENAAVNLINILANVLIVMLQ